MLKHPGLALICASALFTAHPVQAAPPVPQVEVLDTVTLGEPRIDGLKIAELSGLAHDPKTGRLYAVSDKGRLFGFALDVTGGKLVRLEPMSGHNLVAAKGALMNDQGFNAEDIALAEDGTLLIVSETGPRIARFSITGTWLEDLAVPAALRDPATQRSPKDGLESLALHPSLGLLTAPEEPLAARTRTTHTLYAQSGGQLSYDTSAIGSTSIKAMTALPDGRLMILERDVGPDGGLITWLRALDPAHCVSGQLCPTQAAKVTLAGVSDADFEGLVYLAEGLFLIVSDDKIGKDHRSIFALLKLLPMSTN
jgi:hypothetical protein